MVNAPYAVDVTLLRDRVPGFEAYPFNLPAVRNLDVLELHPAVTFVRRRERVRQVDAAGFFLRAESLCTEDCIRRIDYYDTEHYQVTHDFIVNPKRMLDRLLAAGDEDTPEQDQP